MMCRILISSPASHQSHVVMCPLSVCENVVSSDLAGYLRPLPGIQRTITIRSVISPKLRWTNGAL